MRVLSTHRLHLVPATVEHLRAELESREALSRVLGIPVPSTWPPALYDEDAIRATLVELETDPGQAGWRFYYLVRRPGLARAVTLVGAGGFKGPPDQHGSVEIGYSVLPEHQRRGYATEAVLGWSAFAFDSPEVRRVTAQTLLTLPASIRVLERAGFTFVGAGDDPHAPEGHPIVRYELSRDAFTALVAGGDRDLR
jgi:RimJ/RimL family protein N-acetyltransferase